MKKNKPVSENYLLRIPVRPENLAWSADDKGIVTLSIENKGLMNCVAQKLFHKPRISYIHLDKTGSFTWQHIDGQTNIIDLGKLVDNEFGEEAHPLYERLAKFFQVLESYHFIQWAN